MAQQQRHPSSDLRVFGYNFGRTTGASTATLLQALDLCIQKEVDIINMSLGGGRHRVLDTAVDTAVQSGMIACVAAGNSGPRPGSIESPSSAQLAISVAATHGNGRVTSFSSRGPNPCTVGKSPMLLHLVPTFFQHPILEVLCHEWYIDGDAKSREASSHVCSNMNLKIQTQRRMLKHSYENLVKCLAKRSMM